MCRSPVTAPPCSTAAAARDTTPVSYTHLDVYKRQLEHSAILEPCKWLAQQGYEITYLKPDRTGHVTAQQVADALREDTVLVSMTVSYTHLADKMPEGKRADLSLREKERKVQSLQMQGITGSNITVLELVERYLSLKTGVKHNTCLLYTSRCV